MTIEIIESDKIDTALTDGDKDMDIRARAAVQAAIDKAKICKKPIAKYDLENKRAYIEYPDGRKEYV